MERKKVQTTPVVSAIRKRQVDIKQQISGLLNGLGQKKTMFETQIADQESKDSKFTSDLGIAVDQWASDLRSTVTNQLTSLTP
jgi:hypothetical protein